MDCHTLLRKARNDDQKISYPKLGFIYIMTTIKPIIFSVLILAALSIPQTDAFARGEHHSGHGDWTEGGRPEDSKLHTVLRHPEENRSGFTTNDALRERGPEVVTLGGAHGIVHEGDVGAVHPESREKPKAMTDCSHTPGSC